MEELCLDLYVLLSDTAVEKGMGRSAEGGERGNGPADGSTGCALSGSTLVSDA